MRYEALLASGCMPGAPLCWDAGFAERGRPASRRGASILAGKQRGGPRRLTPRAFSRRDFTTAGRERGQGTGPARPTAPGLLAGALVIWAVAGDGMCLGTPWGRGTGA